MTPQDRVAVAAAALVVVRAPDGSEGAQQAAFAIANCVSLGESQRRIEHALRAAYRAGIEDERARAARDALRERLDRVHEARP